MAQNGKTQIGELKDKLSAIRDGCESVVKDAYNAADSFDYVSSAAILQKVRGLMAEHRVMLIPNVADVKFHPAGSLDAMQHLTEMWFSMEWHDLDSRAILKVPWYSQGADNGERGPGKACTYAEKYFLLKFFSIPTLDRSMDPDAQGGMDQRRNYKKKPARPAPPKASQTYSPGVQFFIDLINKTKYSNWAQFKQWVLARKEYRGQKISSVLESNRKELCRDYFGMGLARAEEIVSGQKPTEQDSGAANVDEQKPAPENGSGFGNDGPHDDDLPF